jgi:muramoyltetrapeptide carboxypeptidase
MKITKPTRLIPGDTVCILSPASPSLTTKHFDRGKLALERLGYKVVTGRHIDDRNLLFAGTAQDRAEDINRAFRDRSVKAIICTRGGAGTLHVLPYVDFEAGRQNPKILIGYSDITALQIAILHKTGLITFYGPMAASDMGKRFTEFARSNMFRLLTQTRGRVQLENPPGKAIITICPGEASGRLVGGCLSIVVATLGTEYEIDTRRRIVFFEDIDEKPHRVDRYLTQLMLAGKLEQAKGIVFGTFHKCEYYARDAYYKYGVAILDIIKERIGPLGIPCIYGLQFGHVADKLTIPQGAQATLDATKGRVIVEPAAV